MESNKTTTKYECDICVELFSVSDKVKCEYCDFTACTYCCRTYILDRLDPSCMSSSCGKTWTDEFISKNLNKSLFPEIQIEQKSWFNIRVTAAHF